MSNPHPNTVLFARGTLARLALWPALRLAVHASWGGPASTEKQRWLAGVLVDQFEPFIVASDPASSSSSVPSSSAGLRTAAEPPPDDIYIEELLLQIMSDEFEVALEDDSAAAVARDIINLFSTACAGDDTFVRELEAQADKIKGKVPTYERAVGSGSESGSEWEDDAEEDEDEASEGEPVPRLLDHSEPRREKPQVDEDGFTTVQRKGPR